MSMIFPGMDPYLENPNLWQGVHNSLVVYIRDRLQPQLQPRYVAAVEGRVYVERRKRRHLIPDLHVHRRRSHSSTATAVLEADAPITIRAPAREINESFIRILDLASGNEVVTVIEVLSPSNKYPGLGCKMYQLKQQEVLDSRAHLVEIDLLRTGPYVLAAPEAEVSDLRPFDYVVSVNRAVDDRSEFELYPRTLRQRLPRIRIPLAPPDPDVVLDLQAAVEQTYDAGRYRETLRYDRPCTPPLAPEDQQWANELIRRALRKPSSKRKRRPR